MIGYSKSAQVGKGQMSTKSLMSEIKTAAVKSKPQALKKGKKTLEWEKVRKQLVVDFSKAGIKSCEAKLEGCWNQRALSFAHVDKRRNLEEGEIKKVILACIPCHQILERLGSVEMRKNIEAIIASRKVQP